MIFVGVDWAEAHHDICVLSEAGDVLARRRIPDTFAGVRALHELLGVRKPPESPLPHLGRLRMAGKAARAPATS